jgi:5-methylcytosine-specific restriction endonuclease McrA
MKTKKIEIDETKFVKLGVRWKVFERDGFKCVACGKSAADGAVLHVDHIIPRSKGGKDRLDNYQTLCELCNIGKGNSSEKDLRKQNKT